MLDQRRMSMNPSKAPSLWRAADSGALVVIDLRDGDERIVRTKAATAEEFCGAIKRAPEEVRAG